MNTYSAKSASRWNRILGSILAKKKDFFSIHDSPEKIARGFALGSFISMTPFVGLHLLLAIALAKLFNWNKAAAGLAAFNTNILTGPLIFSFNYILGTIVLGTEPNFSFPNRLGLKFLVEITSTGTDIFLALCIGGCITGIPIALISYIVVKKVFYKRKEHCSHNLNERS